MIFVNCYTDYIMGHLKVRMEVNAAEDTAASMSQLGTNQDKEPESRPPGEATSEGENNLHYFLNVPLEYV